MATQPEAVRTPEIALPAGPKTDAFLDYVWALDQKYSEPAAPRSDAA